MEYASEMIVKALINNYKLTEIPTLYQEVAKKENHI
jgi:hypothetical protein